MTKDGGGAGDYRRRLAPAVPDTCQGTMALDAPEGGGERWRSRRRKVPTNDGARGAGRCLADSGCPRDRAVEERPAGEEIDDNPAGGALASDTDDDLDRLAFASAVVDHDEPKPVAAYRQSGIDHDPGLPRSDRYVGCKLHLYAAGAVVNVVSSRAARE